MLSIEDVRYYHFDFKGVIGFFLDVDFEAKRLVTRYDHYFDIDQGVDDEFLQRFVDMINRAEVWYWSSRLPEGKGEDELPWNSRLVLREQTYEVSGKGDYNSGFTDMLEDMMDIGRSFAF